MKKIKRSEITKVPAYVWSCLTCGALNSLLLLEYVLNKEGGLKCECCKTRFKVENEKD